MSDQEYPRLMFVNNLVALFAWAVAVISMVEVTSNIEWVMEYSGAAGMFAAVHVSKKRKQLKKTLLTLGENDEGQFRAWTSVRFYRVQKRHVDNSLEERNHWSMYRTGRSNYDNTLGLHTWEVDGAVLENLGIKPEDAPWNTKETDEFDDIHEDYENSTDDDIISAEAQTNERLEDIADNT